MKSRSRIGVLDVNSGVNQTPAPPNRFPISSLCWSRLPAFLVPLQDGASEDKAEHDRQQPDPGNPVELAWCAVAAGHKEAHRVEKHGDDDEIGRPEVDAADELPEACRRDDVVHALPRLGRVRMVVLGEIDAGPDQHQHSEEGDAAESAEDVVGVRRDRVREFLEPLAVVDPPPG